MRSQTTARGDHWTREAMAADNQGENSDGLVRSFIESQAESSKETEWPTDEWAVCLLPLLTGEAHAVS